MRWAGVNEVGGVIEGLSIGCSMRSCGGEGTRGRARTIEDDVDEGDEGDDGDHGDDGAFGLAGTDEPRDTRSCGPTSELDRVSAGGGSRQKARVGHGRLELETRITRHARVAAQRGLIQPSNSRLARNHRTDMFEPCRCPLPERITMASARPDGTPFA